MFKVRNELLPEIFISKFKKNKDISVRRIKQNCLYYVSNYRTSYLESTIIVQCPKIGNEYKELLENSCSIGTFKSTAKKFLLSKL